MRLPLSEEFAGLQRAILALHSHRNIRAFRKAVPHIFLGLASADCLSPVDARVQRETRTIEALDLSESRPLSAGKPGEAIERTLQKLGVAQGASAPVAMAELIRD